MSYERHFELRDDYHNRKIVLEIKHGTPTTELPKINGFDRVAVAVNVNVTVTVTPFVVIEPRKICSVSA